MDFSDYIVFADESGDHGLENISDGFPVFVLVFCVVRKKDYIESIVPTMQRLKFDFFGYDGVILHERDIYKQHAPFGFLRTDADLRNCFMSRINGLMADAPIHLFASVIDKRRLVARYSSPRNPYEIALLFCMERVLSFLIQKGQEGRHLHVIIEARGKREDHELELQFRRIAANQSNWGYIKSDFTQLSFLPIFANKQANCTGLQIADLTARPIGLSVIRPQQNNRAIDVIQPKIVQKKCFP